MERHCLAASDDGLSCLFLKFVISYHQVNPIENGVIELVDQIRGQEQHAVIILQFAKKDSHQTIPFQGEFGTPLQEHICFVQQKQSIPRVRCSKHVTKLLF